MNNVQHNIEPLITKLVADNELHGRWLNTLSMMENSGAKKIKRCEHPVFVSEVILRHAAEEARHAYYLKKQIRKLENVACPTYEFKYLLAPKASYSYLNTLDIEVCRYLKSNYGLKDHELKYAAYLLVTYVIEVRADSLYPQYQEVLKKIGSNISVRNIISEEEQHLAEMTKQLKALSPESDTMRKDATAIEQRLYDEWMKELNLLVA